MNVKWGCVLLVILGILSLAYNRDIAAALGQLPIGEVWESFTDEFRAMPRLGRFIAATMVLALLYITGYMLILAHMRSRNGPRHDA
jgi:hypothetical protein